MYILYDILVHMAFVLLIPYFTIRMVFGGKYRTGLAERFGFISKEKLTKLSGARVVWFHAVSVGETKAVMPLARLFRKTHPGIKIVFSTVTPTGQRVAAREGAAGGEGVFDALIYFPLELGWVVRRVVKAIAPEAFIVVEKEVWPNVLRTLNRRKIPVVVVNGTVSEGSFRRYRFFSFFFRRVFAALAFFSARTGDDARRARELGVPAERVIVAGNLKFDFTPPDAGFDIDRLARELGLGPKDRVIVAGSTHAGEEALLIESYIELKREFKGLKLVIAPRHPERFDEVEKLLKESNVDYARRSRAAGAGGDGARVVLLDTIGELSAVYALSTVAFVGGTLVDIGGHNLLEPASFAKPVVYGPYIASCLDMAEVLERSGGGFRVDVAGLPRKLAELLRSDSTRTEAGRAARRVVEENSGATEASARVIEEVLKGELKGGRGGDGAS